MDFLSPVKDLFKKKGEDAPPTASREDSIGSAPRSSGSALSQEAVAQREMNDLAEIMQDAEKLCQLAKDGLESGTLTEDTATIQQLADLSSRLLCRNRAREAAVRFGTALRVTQHTTSTLAAAAESMWPAYFRQSKENSDTGEDVYLSKLFLHGLSAGKAGDGTTLCVRFSLSSRDDEGMYDVSLQALQVYPFDAHSHRFSFSFELQDCKADDAAGWVLDETQRHKLLELQRLLGFNESLWTPVGVLGFVLAAASCAQLEELNFFKDLLRSVREAHREEVLEGSG